MKRRAIWPLPLILVCSLGALSQEPRPQDFANVSLIELIANPAKYDGKLVRVFGFIHLEFEEEAIYLHREDYEKKLFTNAVHVDIDTCKARGSGNFNNGYAEVEGRFVASDSVGKFWSGTIRVIRRCNVLPLP